LVKCTDGPFLVWSWSVC